MIVTSFDLGKAQEPSSTYGARGRQKDTRVLEVSTHVGFMFIFYIISTEEIYIYFLYYILCKVH